MANFDSSMLGKIEKIKMKLTKKFESMQKQQIFEVNCNLSERAD